MKEKHFLRRELCYNPRVKRDHNLSFATQSTRFHESNQIIVSC